MKGKNVFILSTLILIVVMFFSGITVSAETFSAPDGDGSVESPYIITSEDNLRWVASNSSCWGKNFIQTADINLTGNWTPIGNGTNKFTGFYDGRGHIVDNVKIYKEQKPTNDSDTQDCFYLGLFGHVQNGNIINIGVTNVDIKGAEQIGGLAGRIVSSKISNSFATGEISGCRATGGLIGNVDGIVLDNQSCGSGSIVSGCYADVTLTCAAKGFFSDPVRADKCVWNGGLIGLMEKSTVQYCYALGDVNKGISQVGGLIGGIWNDSKVNNCYATGNISGAYRVGGFTGAIHTSVVNNTFSSGVISKNNDTKTPHSGSSLWINGFAGYINGGTTSDCFWNKEKQTITDTDVHTETGVTSDDMKNQSTFHNWDFNNIWEMDTNNPILKKFVGAMTDPFTVNNKTYDRNKDATIDNNKDLIWLKRNESYEEPNDVSLQTEAEFLNENAGTAKQVELKSMEIDNVTEYIFVTDIDSILQNTPKAIANIDKKSITITADNISKKSGESDPELTYQITSGSLIGADSLTGNLTREAGDSAGNYKIKQGTLDNSNYDITFVEGNFSIRDNNLNIQIDYINEELTGFDNAKEYTVNGNDVTISEGAIKIDKSWFGNKLTIIRKDGSISQDLDIPLRPSAPLLPTGVNETSEDAKDGKIISVDSSMEYSTDQSTWTRVTGSEITGLSSGTYYVRKHAMSGAGNKAFASESKVISIVADGKENLHIQIDYINERLTGFDDAKKYTIDGKEVTSNKGAIEIDNWFGKMLIIVKKGDTPSDDSEPQELHVPLRPSEPLSPMEINESSPYAGDGIIIGVDPSMEYSDDYESTWKDILGYEITGLSSGTYFVRKHAISVEGSEAFASESIIIFISSDYQDIGIISGEVTDESDNSIEGASIKLTKQGTQGIAVYTETTDSSGNFTVTNVPYGVYSLVVEKDGKTITKTIIINKPTITQNIVMLSGNKNTVVDVKENTPAIAVENLNNMFTDADNIEASTKKVEIKLIVEKKEESSVLSADKTEIQSKVTTGKKVGIFLDAKLLKTVDTGSAIAIQPPTGEKVLITIDLPIKLQNKAPYEIIRVHNNVAERFPATYNSTLQTLTFEADKFSTYAIAYTESTGSNTSSSSNSSKKSKKRKYYTIHAEAKDGGSILPNGKLSVRERLDKKFTITPKEGYEIEDVLVDGKSVGVVESYTFKSINKACTITAKFKKKEKIEEVEGNPFNDIQEKDWYYECVLEINKRNIMQGISENKFGPNINTTRGMIASIIYRLEDSDEKIESNFTDVDKNQYYYDAIGWAEKNGIVKGYDEDTYGPNDTITREQLVAILYRYSIDSKNSPKPDYTGLTNFNDENEISEYAKPAMAWAYRKDIINGKGNNILDPRGYATRAEVAKIILNYINLK
jgi:hypothetical protein